MAVTWNPSDKNSDCTLSNSNFDASTTTTSRWAGCRATTGYSTGAFYFEVKKTVLGTTDQMISGIADNTVAFNGGNEFPGGGNIAGAGVRRSGDFVNGAGWIDDVATAFGGSDTLNDVYMFAVDITNKKVWRGLNGTWLGSVTPVVGASTQWAHWTGSLTIFPAVGTLAPSSPTAHLQAAAANFSFSAPSGFSAWDPATPSTAVFRRTLSPLGTRVGTRQSIRT